MLIGALFITNKKLETCQIGNQLVDGSTKYGAFVQRETSRRLKGTGRGVVQN